MDIIGQYLYNKNGDVIGIRKGKDSEEQALSLKTIRVSDGSGNWSNTNTYGDFYILGSDIRQANSLYSEYLSSRDYITVESLPYAKIVEMFLSGNMVADELKIGLEAKGASNINIQNDGNTTVVTYKMNGKNCTLNCSTEAAASQIDSISVDVDFSNTSVANKSSGTRVYEQKGDELTELYHQQYGHGPGTINLLASDIESGSFPVVMSNSNLYWHVLDEMANFCLAFFDLPQEGIAKLDVALSDEQRAFVLEHPEIFHFVTNLEQGTGVSEEIYSTPYSSLSSDENFSGFFPDASAWNYILSESLKDSDDCIDQVTQRPCYVSFETIYCGELESFKNTIGKESSNPIYNLELDGNTVTWDEDTVNAFYDCINNQQYIDLSMRPNLKSWEINSNVGYTRWLNIQNVFGLAPGDSKETIQTKLEQFFKSCSSSDGKSLNIEDYYNSLSPLVTRTYDELKSDYEAVQNEVRSLGARADAAYAARNGINLGDTIIRGTRVVGMSSGGLNNPGTINMDTVNRARQILGYDGSSSGVSNSNRAIGAETSYNDSYIVRDDGTIVPVDYNPTAQNYSAVPSQGCPAVDSTDEQVKERKDAALEKWVQALSSYEPPSEYAHYNTYNPFFVGTVDQNDGDIGSSTVTYDADRVKEEIKNWITLGVQMTRDSYESGVQREVWNQGLCTYRLAEGFGVERLDDEGAREFFQLIFGEDRQYLDHGYEEAYFDHLESFATDESKLNAAAERLFAAMGLGADGGTIELETLYNNLTNNIYLTNGRYNGSASLYHTDEYFKTGTEMTNFFNEVAEIYPEAVPFLPGDIDSIQPSNVYWTGTTVSEINDMYSNYTDGTSDIDISYVMALAAGINQADSPEVKAEKYLSLCNKIGKDSLDRINTTDLYSYLLGKNSTNTNWIQTYINRGIASDNAKNQIIKPVSSGNETYDSTIKVAEGKSYKNAGSDWNDYEIGSAEGAKFVRSEESVAQIEEIQDYILSLTTDYYDKWYQYDHGSYKYFKGDGNGDAAGYENTTKWKNEADRQACFNDYDSCAEKILDKYGDKLENLSFDGFFYTFYLKGGRNCITMPGNDENTRVYSHSLQPCCDNVISYTGVEVYDTDPPKALPEVPAEWGTPVRTKWDGILVSENSVFYWNAKENQYVRYEADEKFISDLLKGDDSSINGGNMDTVGGNNYYYRSMEQYRTLFALVYGLKATSSPNIYYNPNNGKYYSFDQCSSGTFGGKHDRYNYNWILVETEFANK